MGKLFKLFFVGNQGVSRYSYHNIPSTYLYNLRNSPNYPDKPDGAAILPWFESYTTKFMNNYGERLEAFFTPCESGFYSFIISGDDQHELLYSDSRNYSDLTSIAYSSTYTKFRNYNTRSIKLWLNHNHSYLLVSEFKDSGGSDFVSVGVIKHDTELTYFDTEQVSIENQTVSITTDYLREIQSLSISIPNSLGLEIQETFTLRLGGKSTPEINVFSLLMFPNQDCFNSQNGIDYRGTASHTRGGIKCQNWNVNSPNTPPVSTESNGLGDHNFCRNPDNSPGGPWCYYNSTIGWDYCNIDHCIGNALEYLLSAQCTGHEYNEASDLFAFDFEPNDLLRTFSHISKTLSSSFCGQYSIDFFTWDTITYKFEKETSLPLINDAIFLCMAYNIAPNVPFVISFEILVADDYYSWFSFVSSFSQNSKYLIPHGNKIIDLFETLYDNSTWIYTCFDILKSISLSEYPLTMEILHLVRSVEIRSIKGTNLIKLDVLSLSYDVKSVKQILPPVHPNGMTISNIDIEVDFLNNNLTKLTSFNFSFTTTDCASGMSLLEANNSNNLILVDTKRVQTASQPIRGDFTITFNYSQSQVYSVKQIQYNENAEEFLSKIEKEFLIGNVKGGIIQNENICRERKFWISFYNFSGDLESVVIDRSNLTGNNLSVSIEEITPGGLIIAPIPGHMLRTVNRKPQVIVKRHGKRASCKGPYTQNQHNSLLETTPNFCDFTFTNASQPLIISVNPTNTCVNSLLIITGSSFGYSRDDISVLIGTGYCNITTISDSNITCIMPHSVGGLLRVLLTKLSYGIIPNSNYSFIRVCYKLLNISHTRGSILGGLVLTIESNNGFLEIPSGNSAFSMQIEMANSTCRILSSNHTHVKCSTPPSEAETVDITVKLYAGEELIGNDSLLQIFTYSLNDTPSVSGISKLNGSVLGGDIIELFVNLPPSENIEVYFSEAKAKILTFNSTSIQVLTPRHSPGRVKIVVIFENLGLANIAHFFDYLFYICDVSQDFGSLFGGQTLILTGIGFSTGTVITIGQNECDIISLSNTQITCTTRTTHSSYYIHRSRSGLQPNQFLHIYPGDEVVWSWSNLNLNENLKVSITSIFTPISPLIKKAQSDTSSSATFQHSFLTAGDYYYTVGPELSSDLSHPADCYEQNEQYHGRLSITETYIPCLAWTSQFVQDHFKFNDPLLGDHNYCRNPDGDSRGPWCFASNTMLKTYCNIQNCGVRGIIYVSNSLPIINTTIDIILDSFKPNIYSSCQNISLSDSQVNDYLNYSYLPSSTPQVFRVLAEEIIKPGTILKLIGTNFASDIAGISINISDSICSPINISNEDSISILYCVVPNLQCGNYRISLHVRNLGWAFFWDDSNYISISSIIISTPSPENGSIFGGSLLTIQGHNFYSTNTDEYQVLIGNTPCSLQEILINTNTSQYLVCLTQKPIDDGYSSLILPLNPISYWTFDNTSNILLDKGSLKDRSSKTDSIQLLTDDSHINIFNQLHYSAIFYADVIETHFHPAYSNFEGFGIELWIRFSSPKLKSILNETHKHDNNSSSNGYQLILENVPYSNAPGGYRIVLNPCNRLEFWVATGKNETKAGADECIFTPQLNCSLECSGIRRVYSFSNNSTFTTWHIISGPVLNTSSFDWFHIAFGWEIIGGALGRKIYDPGYYELRSQCSYERGERKYCDGTVSVFINGIIYGSANITYSPGMPVSQLLIGGSPQLFFNGFDNFTGIMDEIVVYPVPLTLQAAQLHYDTVLNKHQIIKVYSSCINYVGTGVTPLVQYPDLSDNYNEIGRVFKPKPNQYLIEWKIKSHDTLSIKSDDFVTFYWNKLASLIEINQEYYSSCDTSIQPLKVLSSFQVQYVVNISLEPGDHYFTSQVEEQCEANMKIKIHVQERSPLKSLVIKKSLSTIGFQSFLYLYPQITISNLTSNWYVGTTLSFILEGTFFETDNFTIKIGQVTIFNISSASNKLTCLIPNIEAGNYDIQLVQNNFGYVPFNSSGNLIYSQLIEILPYIQSIEPTSGSLDGGTVILIIGSGFSTSLESVLVTGLKCDILLADLTTITCQTVRSSENNNMNISTEISVSVNNINSPIMINYNLLDSKTPLISFISSNTNLSLITKGSKLTVTGTLFTVDSLIRIIIKTNPYNPTCYKYAINCSTNYSANGNLECTVPILPGGMYNILVYVPGLGYASGNKDNPPTFNVIQSVTSVNPNIVGTAGGVILTITGSGFITSGSSIGHCKSQNRKRREIASSNQNLVTICDLECIIIDSTESTINCVSPSILTDVLQPCNISVSSNSIVSQLNSAIQYDPSVTPVVHSFTPVTGGTGGGTILTIFGTNFQNARDIYQYVKVGTANCSILSWNDSMITCRTGSHSTNRKAIVSVFVTNVGFAEISEQTYAYIDRWSSNFTWGGASPPREGETVFIPKQFIVLLDISPPPLNLILIEGELIFEDSLDISLNAKYIVVNGGYMQIGTEENPFLHKAIITLYGNILDPEIPLYGAKVLAVRQGGLDFHGIKRSRTWTKLSETANMNQKYIKVRDFVDWAPGDSIVIAPTGKDSNETEVRLIVNVSNNGYTINFETKLDFSHLGITDTYNNGEFIELRAEVGLLSHNIVIQGSQLSPSDPRGIESDLYGGHFMVFRPKPDPLDVRVSNVEFRNMGQAFRLGRYSVHFHLSDRMNGSYVRHCSIHHSFNRAITAHGVEDMLFEGVVVFDIQGHAFFIEDGIEFGNRYINNLGILIRGSSSLLNTDSIPAVFWITNPNNTFEDNSAVASRAYGFWYDLDPHPSGPSETSTVCPNKNPFGGFKNNIAHSNAEFGLRIWETYVPLISPCNTASAHATVTLYNLTSYANGIHGVEFSIIGNVQVDGFKLADNRDNGIEITETVGDCFVTEIKNTLIIARTIANSGLAQSGGIRTMRRKFLRISNVTFVNFNEENTVCMRACSHCKSFQGGFHVEFQGIKFIGGSQRRAAFQWEHEVVYVDIDGTFTGNEPGSIVVPNSNILPSDLCNFSVPEFSLNSVVPGAVCSPKVKMLRLAWNDVNPRVTFEDKLANITNQYGSTLVPWRKKRLTHSRGYMVMLPANNSYTLSYIISDEIKTDITSYQASIYHLMPGDYITIDESFYVQPDHFNLRSLTENTNNRNSTNSMLDPLSDHHLDWHFDNLTNKLTYLLRGDINTNFCSPKSFSLTSEPCPVDENDVAHCEVITPTDGLYETNPRMWSNPEHWPSNSLPLPGEDVIIESTWRMHLDMNPPQLGSVYIYGELNFDDTQDLNFTAEIILIQGINAHLVIGTPQVPFQHNAIITLKGNRSSKVLVLSRTMNLGSKAIGIFGNLSIYGNPPQKTWSKLAQTAQAGSSEIILDTVSSNWNIGETIVIAATGYDAGHTETAIIASVNGKTLTLEDTLQYEHLVQPFLANISINDQNNVAWKNPPVLAAEVALLSRNIIIQGGEDDEGSLEQFHFGCRILSGEFSTPTNTYTGHFEIDGVEIRNCGQGGFFTSRDPRYSLAVKNGRNNMKNSFISASTIHHGYNTAIGIHVTNGIRIQNNVIYRTVDSGIRVGGSSNIIEDNLVLLVTSVHPGDPLDKHAVDYPASFEVQGYHIVRRNIAAGSYRLGFRVSGESCVNSSTPMIHDNLAHTTWTGMLITGVPEECTAVSTFTSIWAWNYGIFSQTVSSLSVSQVVIAVGKIGLNLNTLGPDPIKHLLGNKYVYITNSLIIGVVPGEVCNYDIPAYFTVKNTLSAQTSKSGIMMSYMNKNPFKIHKEWHKASHYPVIDGDCKIINVTFVNFNERGCSFSDFSITNNPVSPDAVTPITIEKSKLIQVDSDLLMHFYPPNPAWIVQEDCVDMDCDGPKHALVRDIDGTFTSNNNISTTLIPVAEIRFDESKIPRTWRYDPISEQLVDPSIIAPMSFRGIARGYNLDNVDSSSRGCRYISKWNGYKCDNINHYVLVIESLDKDTEIRRLSPIALNGGDIGNGRYTDLINGPMDHGWCTSYTCLKRISNFYTLVVSGTEYSIWLTSTTPSHVRFHLLNSDDEPSNPGSVLINIWYKDTRRKDAYLNRNLVTPLNQGDNDFRYLGDEYIPNHSQPSGSNYYDYRKQTMHLLVKGSSPVSIKTADVVQLSFTLSVSLEQFFDPFQFLSNLAHVLNIDMSTIRIVNVISESRRKRQSTTDQVLTVEVGESPEETIDVPQTSSISEQIMTFQDGIFTPIDAEANETATEIPVQPPTIAPIATTDIDNDTTVPTPMEFSEEYQDDLERYEDDLILYYESLDKYNELNNLAELIVTIVQTNNFTVENATITGLEIQLPTPPIPPPAPIIPPSYANIKTENNQPLLTPVQEISTEEPLSSSCNLTQGCDSGIQILIPATLVIVKQPVEVSGHLIHVVLEVRDSGGSLITQLGLSNPWKCSATLFSTNYEDSSVPNITGITEVNFDNGIAEFTRLRVDSIATNLHIFFTTYPGNLVSENSIEFDIIAPSANWPRIIFSFRLQGDYNLIATDIAFKEILVYTLISAMDVDKSRLQDLALSSGSILVYGELLEPLDSDPPNVPTSAQALDQLRTVIGINGFLFAYNGKNYTAESSSFISGPKSTVSPPTINFIMILAILIGFVAMILFIILVAIVLIGIRIFFVIRKKNKLIAAREDTFTNLYTEVKSSHVEIPGDLHLAQSIKAEGTILMNPIYDFDSLPKVNTPATEEKFEFFAARSIDQDFRIPGTPIPPETDLN